MKAELRTEVLTQILQYMRQNRDLNALEKFEKLDPAKVRSRMSVSNLDMSQSAGAALGLALLSNLAAAGTVPKLPTSIAGVVEVANVQPAKIVKPVYPPAARQAWH